MSGRIGAARLGRHPPSSARRDRPLSKIHRSGSRSSQTRELDFFEASTLARIFRPLFHSSLENHKVNQRNDIENQQEPC